MTFVLNLIPRFAADLFHGLEDLLFPPLCEVCGTRLPPGVVLVCDPCLRALPFQGLEREVRLGKESSPLDGIFYLYAFDELVQQLIHALKYAARPTMARRLVEPHFGSVKEKLKQWEIDTVLPVPLHPRKQRERGYNQVASLAQFLARVMKLRYEPHLLRRKRYTQSQTNLSAQERKTNVAGAFVVQNRVNLAGRRILLLDDVVTTGATAEACALPLKAAGAKVVFLMALATPPLQPLEENSESLSYLSEVSPTGWASKGKE